MYSYCYDPFCVSLNRRGKSVHPVVYNNFDNAPSIRKPFILDLQYLHRYDFVRWANYYFYNRSDWVSYEYDCSDILLLLYVVK